MKAVVGRFKTSLVGLILLTGCAGTQPPLAITTIGPYPHPHGRIILLGKHRAQLLFSCQQISDADGKCQFTHAASGRIMELHWQHQQIWQRTNIANQQQWQPVTLKTLYQLGLVIHPRTMIQLLNGTIPSWLHHEASNRWQGRYRNSRIQMQWFPELKRLDITNLSKGAQVRLLLNND